jgi:hypothetical protein
LEQLKRLLNISAVGVASVVAALVARHFALAGWPLHHANLWLVGVAAVVLLAA